MKKLITISLILFSLITFSQTDYKNSFGINLVGQRVFFDFGSSGTSAIKTNFLTGLNYVHNFQKFDTRFNVNYYSKNEKALEPEFDDGPCGEINIKEVEIMMGIRKNISQKKISTYVGIDYCLAYVIDNSIIASGWGGLNVEKYSWRHGVNFNFGLEYKIKDRIGLNWEVSVLQYNRTAHTYGNSFYLIPVSFFGVSYGF
ncbi:MAG: hypothetical protein JXR58_10635 [Bacteroidales bacterium]|nr:hypothetical protein [Bacteroidales bacterium]